jgi:uncharacterized protein (DUF1499 family)
MLKIFIACLLLFFVAAAAWLFNLGRISQEQTSPGLIAGKLSPCPDKPNCLCSEFEDNGGQYRHHTQPLSIAVDTDSEEALLQAAEVIRNMGGEVLQQDDLYLASTFTSKLFRYVDDLELRLDPENRLLHLRSASRVGHGDMGANAARIKEFKQRYLNNGQ